MIYSVLLHLSQKCNEKRERRERVEVIFVVVVAIFAILFLEERKESWCLDL